MGMFDYITCEMDLPREGEEIPYFRYEHPFQTKDLDNALIEYKIGKDRVLYEKKVEYEETEATEEEKKDLDSALHLIPSCYFKEKSHEWVKYEHTGYINFYDFINDVDESSDAWVEYEVHVKGGKVQGEIGLNTFYLEDNTKRKESRTRFNAERKARKEYEQKWRYRFFGQYWNRLINRIFRGVHWLGDKLSASWKLKAKLKL